jgi:hypothetical protein
MLLALLGGGLCVWGAQSAIGKMEYALHRGPQFFHVSQFFDIFYNLGITDWRAQFGIGATVGAGCAVVYLKKRGRKVGK